jgi:hypothetical protein
MIVVEGPDGAGKTTFISQLVEKTGLEVAPRVVAKDTTAMVDLQRWVHENVTKGWHETIYDRHRLISEPIYGATLRPEAPEPGFDNFSWFYAMLEAFYESKPIVIYCLPPLEVVWRNVMTDEDNKVFHRNGRAVWQIWMAYMNKACTEYALRKHQTFIYDYTTDDPWYYIHQIERQIEKRRA